MHLDRELLRELCECPAPSGFEGAVQAIVRRRLASVAGVSVEADPIGNLWAAAGPEDGTHVIAVAHADQIGMVVTHIDERGFIRFGAVGWLDQQLLPGHTVLIHGGHGPVRGVVGKPPTHIVPEAERGKAAPFSEQYIDIGAADRESAAARVAVGDAVTFDRRFHELAPGRVVSPAIDDRAGVYAVVRALEQYAAAPGRARLTCVSTAHEETTVMGAKAMRSRLSPACAIIVDGDFASDHPGVDAMTLGGEILLGGGPVIGLGSTTNRKLSQLALEVAAQEQIPVQTKAYPGRLLTDAEELAGVSGVASMALSIPMRYVHSTSEVADEADIERTAALITALTRRLGEVYRQGCFTP